MSAPVRVVFLAGVGRSGTTLVERTLAEVDGVTALGEVMHLWDRGLVRGELCGCGAPFRDCPFWHEVGELAFGGWDHVDAARMAHLKARVDRATRVPAVASGRPRSLAAEVREYADHYVRLYRAASELTGGVVVDSSKQVSLAWCLQTRPEIDLRVVHCVRDSRGVAYSWSKDVARPEAVSEEYGRMPRYSAPAVSALWLLHNAEIEALRRRVPVQRLRYEDFVADPARVTRDVLELAEVDAPVDHVGADTILLGSSHSCAGNPMRFRTGAVPVRADEAWRASAPHRQRRAVTALTAPLLARYGYPL
ncbi:sulfotransferase [Nocardioides sp. URHA0020]|uniref:sulfotransferase n=1 Tax=Nocardioides sp. URHA0020 TaxID=1380392 RepID=UPI0004908CA3|nr:sulfotransferase [Nocardioides sp. URHA0020]